jgi:hypothetical protein
MSTRSEHWATDVPRFTRIVSPEEINGRRVYGLVIEHIEFDWDAKNVVYHFEGDPDAHSLPTTTRVTVETTPKREQRLADARALLARADQEEELHLPGNAERCTCPMSVRERFPGDGDETFGDWHSHGCPMFAARVG